ncbi:MAG: DUF3791 domain-containing protein [Anaerovoracaceae bacterium]
MHINTKQKERDENLIVVSAVDGYARKYNMPAIDAFKLFQNKGIINLLRNQYEVLHTQSLDESLEFAEDILLRRQI